MVHRNGEYFFQYIIFQVEDQLFRVPKHMFVNHSPIFRTTFELPVAEGAIPDGSSEEQPFVLDGVKVADFIPLLECLYPLKFRTTFSFTLEEWTSIFKLATIYDMEAIRNLAIKSMQPQLANHPSLKVHLAKHYDVKDWLVPGLVKLVQRKRPLDEDDVQLIGLTDALKVAALREDCRRSLDARTWLVKPRGEVLMDFTPSIQARFNL
ncbi:hypothetical protein AMATHDRAFT_6818 [Amanita thiersii Skay4041]|uniref:BTB domain-containing protein n=1 Tax=Amanita thiersii Skay4041 TaxID=703135 RepID=A0A2A9NGK1_9AGAR|nr:hypothetical protein AMATHDRAFT_6818 [Amanita thiersii Skay4041]